MGRLRAWDVCPACTNVYAAGSRCATCARALDARIARASSTPPPAEHAPLEARRIEIPDASFQIRPPRLGIYMIGVGLGVVAVLVLAAMTT